LVQHYRSSIQAKKSRLSARLMVISVCLLMAIFISTLCPQYIHAQTEISVSYSFPMISEHSPPADRILEGSRTATISCDGIIRPLGNPPWLTRINDREYSALFLWDDTTVRLVRFLDSNNDTTDVLLLPETNMPVDLVSHEGPIFHIRTNAVNLWDQETGIYVWGHHDNFLQTGELWERPAVVDFYDEAGDLVFTEPIGLRINGRSSRSYHQKGLRLYFDDYGVSDTIEYDFFQGGPTSFERLVLRGNRYPDFAISSAANEPLHQDLGHKGSRHRSVAVYLNNEFWGAYSLRERLDDEFVEKTWQWANDGDFILIKDREAEAGDYGEWENFLAGFSGEGPFDSHRWYEETSAQIDLVSYVDWLMINVCGASSDNMAGKNLAILKLGNGPWQYMTWDEDILYQNSNILANHLRFYSAGDHAEFVEFQPPAWYSGGPWDFIWAWNNMLRGLMQNAEFKSLLRHRGAELLDGRLSVEQTIARMDSVAVHQQPEWVNHGLRWQCSSQWYPVKLSQFQAFVTTRHGIVQNHLAEFLEHWAQPVELVSFSLTELEASVVLEWTTERENDCTGFVVQRSIGSENDFETIGTWQNFPDLTATGGIGITASYAFSDTSFPENEDAWYRIVWESGNGVGTPLSWVETTESSPVLALRINEFMALNESTIMDEFGEYEDWLEIHNPGDEAVSTAGLFLSDDFSTPTRWALPDVIIPAQGFLLVWCDSDVEQGPLHAGFKISGSGEELGLYSSILSGNLEIDTVSFGAQQPDVSSGRQPDGSGQWAFLDNPTPGTSNLFLSSVATEPTFIVGQANAWPNPFNPSTSISFELISDGNLKLRIFDIRGRLVTTLHDGVLLAGAYEKAWDGCDLSGQKVASGLYFVMLETGQRKQTIKLVLLN